MVCVALCCSWCSTTCRLYCSTGYIENTSLNIYKERQRIFKKRNKTATRTEHIAETGLHIPTLLFILAPFSNSLCLWKYFSSDTAQLTTPT
uniref:Putative secreted peptide n=1 Tax=Anopheles braziliensis TaxID=58242 RepID=A0A2M3ZS33_9DIPT